MRRSFLMIPGILLVFCFFVGMAAADRLPNETPENQVYSMTSSVEAIGQYTGSQSMQWTAGFDPQGTTINFYEAESCLYLSNFGITESVFLEAINQLKAGGGDISYGHNSEGYYVCWMEVPVAMLNTVIIGTEQHPVTFGGAGAVITGDGPTETYVTGHGGLHTGTLDNNEVRSTTAYSESTQTNGGYVAETKSFDPDTRNKATGLFNVESTKTFTYATDENTGSVAQTSESITMDNMGEITRTRDVVACPFGPAESYWFPAFCNVVYAKSMSQGVTSASMSSSAQTRTVAGTADVPAELNYNFDVKPDASAGTGYAMGTFGTEFGVSIREERGLSNSSIAIPSITGVYTDSASAGGLIAKFTKQYAYRSGFRV